MGLEPGWMWPSWQSQLAKAMCSVRLLAIGFQLSAASISGRCSELTADSLLLTAIGVTHFNPSKRSRIGVRDDKVCQLRKSYAKRLRLKMGALES